MPEILFVCSVNRFRSVIAAEYFRHLLKQEQVEGEWNIVSAGTWAKEGLAPLPEAMQFAHANGFEISGVRSREVNTDILDRTDLIIVMGEGHREALSLEFPEVKKKIHLLSEVCEGQRYDIPDLGESEDDTAEELGGEITNLLDKGFHLIIKKAAQRNSTKSRD
jgi:protein-tyrosine phosphatase